MVYKYCKAIALSKITQKHFWGQLWL